jgi:multidrug resistance efflux pump
MNFRCAFTLAAVVSLSCSSGPSPAARGVVLRAHRGTFANDALLTGQLEAARGDSITVPNLPNWQTTIKWLAPDGSAIRSGERVAELDATPFATQLDQKRQTATQAAQELQQKEAEWTADRMQKQLDLEKKRADLEKAVLEAAIPRELLSDREFDARATKLRGARVEFEKARDVLRSQETATAADRANLQLKRTQAEREVQLAESAISELVLNAARDGIVVLRDQPWQGRKLQAGDMVYIGFQLALIPEPSSLQVAASLADVDDGRIAVGMPATVALDGYPGAQYTGRVTSISAVAQESSSQSMRRSFRVVVTLDHIDTARMRPGLSARVMVRRETKNAVLLAPRVALDMAAARPRARLADGGVADVTLGSCNALDCIVTGGLADGQTLAPWETTHA